MPSEAEGPGISRAVRLPQWLDLKVIDYCRRHKIMQAATGAEGKTIRIPNISQGMIKILEEFFKCQDNGK